MKEFEKWALRKELDIQHHPNSMEFDYYDIETQLFWECWQEKRGWIATLATKLMSGLQIIIHSRRKD